MKVISFLLMAASLTSLPVNALERDSIIIIKPDTGKKHYNNNAQLWERIHRLERAVAQLQDQVFQLSTSQIQVASNYTTCMIKTPFHGSFHSTSPTKMAAVAQATEKCMAGTSNNDIYCSDKYMSCGN